MKVLITGTAGFIGFHLAQRLLNEGHEVMGLDNINEYYDVELKYSRLAASGIDRTSIILNRPVQSTRFAMYRFVKANLEDQPLILKLFESEKFDFVVNLAAQAGVRYSLQNPHAYIQSNITGFLNILEACRHFPVKHLVYASSSSVYGLNESYPFSIHEPADHPISLYAASKRSNELMAHAYSHLYGIPTTGLRFFTVYGPWGRPDMALFIFTRSILEGKPIDVYNNGEMERDFTYVDDIVEGIVKVMGDAPKPDPLWDSRKPDPSCSRAAFRVYNIGNSRSVKLTAFIDEIEQTLGVAAKKNFMPMQAGDVAKTWADVSDLKKNYGYQPKTPVSQGVRNFIAWYRDYYKV